MFVTSTDNKQQLLCRPHFSTEAKKWAQDAWYQQQIYCLIRSKRARSLSLSEVPVMHWPLWLGAPHPVPGCSAETSSWCYLLSSLILPHPEPPACLLDIPSWPVRLTSSSCVLHTHWHLRNASPCTDSLPLRRQNSSSTSEDVQFLLPSWETAPPKT